MLRRSTFAAVATAAGPTPARDGDHVLPEPDDKPGAMAGLLEGGRE